MRIDTKCRSWRKPELLGPETYSLTAFREAETIVVPNAAEMDVAIEGSTSWWPNEKNEAVLPEFDRFNRQRYYIKVFNRSRNRSAMTLAPLFPALEKLDSSSPRLEYELHLHSKGKVTVKALLSPMLNFYDDQGLRYAISFDDELVQFINLLRVERSRTGRNRSATTSRSGLPNIRSLRRAAMY